MAVPFCRRRVARLFILRALPTQWVLRSFAFFAKSGGSETGFWEARQIGTGQTGNNRGRLIGPTVVQNGDNSVFIDELGF